MILISKIDNLLLNDYNKALDYKTSNMSRIIGFRSIFLGSSFTLLATIFTVSVIEIWVYILIILDLKLVFTQFFFSFFKSANNLIILFFISSG